ncbi:MAG: hypothetical protein AB7G11_07455 [Phycisphaerales bacterium]
MKCSNLLAAIVVMTLATGVGSVVHARTRPNHQPAKQSLPPGVALDKIPAQALELGELAKTAKVGQHVTFRGRIPLAKDAIDPRQASFVLVDDAAAAECCPKDGSLLDTCNAPAHSKASVQLVDKDAKPLTSGLDGKGALHPGVEVFVVGEVTATGDDAPMQVRATAIHVPQGSLPIGFFAADMPTDVKDVSDARTSGLKKGDSVALRGLVGGSKTPFVDGRAVFTLMGKGLKPCNANPDDHCKTPWDYCCETKADIAANSATVRVSDKKGNPLRTDFKGRLGISELSELIVIGKVVFADKGSLVVEAEKILPMKK